MNSMRMGQMRSWKMIFSRDLSKAKACARWLAVLGVFTCTLASQRRRMPSKGAGSESGSAVA